MNINTYLGKIQNFHLSNDGKEANTKVQNEGQYNMGNSSSFLNLLEQFEQYTPNACKLSFHQQKQCKFVCLKQKCCSYLTILCEDCLKEHPHKEKVVELTKFLSEILSKVISAIPQYKKQAESTSHIQNQSQTLNKQLFQMIESIQQHVAVIQNVCGHILENLSLMKTAEDFFLESAQQVETLLRQIFSNHLSLDQTNFQMIKISQHIAFSCENTINVNLKQQIVFDRQNSIYYQQLKHKLFLAEKTLMEVLDLQMNLNREATSQFDSIQSQQQIQLTVQEQINQRLFEEKTRIEKSMHQQQQSQQQNTLNSIEVHEFQPQVEEGTIEIRGMNNFIDFFENCKSTQQNLSDMNIRIDLSYNNLKLSHLQTFAELLQPPLKSVQSLSLNFCTNAIGQEGVAIIMQSLETMPTLTSLSLNLDCNQITVQGTKLISLMLKQLSNINQLNLSVGQNDIADSGAEFLAQGIRTMRELKQLSLGIGFNEISENGLKHICEAIQCLLLPSMLNINMNANQSSSGFFNINLSQLSLDLGFNKIGIAGWQILGDCIKDMQRIELLDLFLNNNQIKDDGLNFLSETLGSLKKLKSLNLMLNGNGITDAGANKLSIAIANISTLENLVLNMRENDIKKGDIYKKNLKKDFKSTSLTKSCDGKTTINTNNSNPQRKIHIFD